MTTADRLGERASGVSTRVLSYPRIVGLRARGARVAWSAFLQGGVHCLGQVSALTIGEDSAIERHVRLTVAMRSEASLTIGARTLIGEGTHVTAHCGLTIGDDVLIAAYCQIIEFSHGTRPGTPVRDQPTSARRISIGDGVWLGAGVTVLPGVEIGAGAVVGAGSVVTSSVPGNAIVVGVPARYVRSR